MGQFLSGLFQPSPSSVIKKVRSLASKWREAKDRVLRDTAMGLRERAKKGESLNRLMPEAFALTVVAAERTLRMCPFDTQIHGGVELARSKIVEMKTGEGKTLAATMPAFLHSLYGKGVHVVTVNDYLAKRDASWMGPLYELLGATVGCIQEDMSESREEEIALRRAAYACDITYVTNSECVFDYLRDNLASTPDEVVHRGRHAAILDEVDLLLVDEAQMPLIISGPASFDKNVIIRADEVIRRLVADRDYEVDHRFHAVSFTEEGQERVEEILGVGSLSDPENLAWAHAVHQSLQAHGIQERNVDYIVQNGSVYIIDEHTGRVSPDKRYSNGLHQALEAKERLVVRSENRTLSKTSYQHYFRAYTHLAGMTGTAWTIRGELEGVYGLRTARIPTHRPMIRKDYKTVLYRTAKEKREAVAKEIASAHEIGRPVLLGTLSVEESEAVSSLLHKRKIPHSVLNAKQNEQEALVISKAGRLGAVTVSTAMAGRGTDIMLGGDPRILASELISKDAPEAEAEAEAEAEMKKLEETCAKERVAVVQAGGLLVIGTGEHESERIDDQLRGRSGRQGDPGASRFYISLEDPVYQEYGEKKVLPQLMERTAGHPEGAPITDPSVFSALKALKRNIEITNASSRKDVLKFDAVLEERRAAIWARRRALMTACDPDEWQAQVEELIEDLVDRLSEKINVEAEEAGESLHRGEVWRRVLESVQRPSFHDEQDDEAEPDLSMGREEVVDRINALYKERLGRPDDAQLFDWERAMLLSVIDNLWPQYLNELEGVEQDVHLRAYAQTDPFVAFRTEAASMFGKLMHDIELMALRIWLSAKSFEEVLAAAQSRSVRSAASFAAPRRAHGYAKKKKPKEKSRTKKKIKARE